jgi:Na+/melibiose symporter-like transporter
MNSLTWLVYFLGVVSEAHTVVSFFAAVSFVGAFIFSVAWGANAVDDGDASIRRALGSRRIFGILSTIMIVASVVLVFLPSDRVLALMAASEIGARAVNTPGFEKVEGLSGKSLKLLEQFIDREIDKGTPKIIKESK